MAKRGRPFKNRDPLEGVQVIQVKTAVEKEAVQKQSSQAWEKTLKLSKEVKNLGIEVQVLIDELAIKWKALNEKVIETYSSAPKTDCSLTASPLSSAKLLYFLKLHMFKSGFRVDNTYVSDINKIKEFKETVREGTDWLTKFSN